MRISVSLSVIVVGTLWLLGATAVALGLGDVVPDCWAVAGLGLIMIGSAIDRRHVVASLTIREAAAFELGLRSRLKSE